MPRPSNKKPRSYGRQHPSKTSRTVSLEKEVLEEVAAEAKKRGMSFSELVNGILKGTITISLLAFFAGNATVTPLEVARIVARLTSASRHLSGAA